MRPSPSTYHISNPCRSIVSPHQTDTICGLQTRCAIGSSLLYIPLLTRTDLHLGDGRLELGRPNLGSCVSVLGRPREHAP
jgi:hypothetical protein